MRMFEQLKSMKTLKCKINKNSFSNYRLILVSLENEFFIYWIFHELMNRNAKEQTHNKSHILSLFLVLRY